MPQTTDAETIYRNSYFNVNAGEVVVGTTPVPPSAQDPLMPFYVMGSQNAYFGINVYNFNAGATASADMVVQTTAGTGPSVAYTDFGMVGPSNTDTNYSVFDASAGYAFSQKNNMYVSSGTGGTTFLTAGGFSGKQFVGLAVDNNQNVVAGTGAVGSAGTAGFFYIRSGAGVPTGTPQAKTGMVPMYYDSTNNNFYMYAGASWKKASTGGTWA